MIEKNYPLRILTSERVFYEGRVVSLVAPGELGYLGVLANHAPLITTCVPGTFRFREPEGKVRLFKTGNGFLEVLRNEVTFLTEEISEAEESHG